MPRSSQILTNFTAGELSPLLYGRADVAWWRNGCKLLTGMASLPHGPAMRVPGFRYISDVIATATSSRLIPFIFSTVQAYIIEAGSGKMRFFRDGGRIEVTGVPVEVTTPYSGADTVTLNWTQSADTLYLAHVGHKPRTLTRTSHTAWSIAAFAAAGGPFLDADDSGTAIQASAATGSGVTLTAGAAVWQAAHVGALWRLDEADPSNVQPWEQNRTYALNDLVRSDGKVYICSDAGTSGAERPLHEEGARYDGQAASACGWTFVHRGYGIVEITGFTSATEVTVTVVDELPADVVSAGTETWAEGAWSDVQGWPSAVTFWQGRLWFAATRERVLSLWGSRSQDFTNFRAGTEDDAALALTLDSDEVNAIRWMVPGRRLLIGTSGGEWSVGASSLEEAVTPTNVQARRQTAYGSAAIRPVVVGEIPLFWNRQQRRLRELVYSIEREAYVAPDVIRRAEHLGQIGINESVVQREPWDIVWNVGADGTLIGFTYVREEQVTAWWRRPLGGNGKVEKLAVIPGTTQDELWAVVQRTVNGALQRNIERLDVWPDHETDHADMFYVDAGLTYDGAATTSIGGLDHLEGEEVAIMADGATHPPQIVSAGFVDLEYAASKVHVGFGYDCQVTPMPIDAGQGEGTAMGKHRRVDELQIRVHRSQGFQVGRTDGTPLEAVPLRDFADLMDTAVPLFSGVLNVPFPGTYERECEITVRQPEPQPLTIQYIVSRVSANDG